MATFGSLRRASARFDSFQVDLSSSELFRAGVRVPIQEQPLQVLRLLLEAEGKVVTREQLRMALWPQDTFVDFEHGVNTAVKKVRQALDDSAENPQFVETLPKIGYRFIASVEWVADAHIRSATPRVVPIGPPGSDVASSSVPTEVAPPRKRGRWLFAPIAIGLVLLAAIGGYLQRPRARVSSDKLTIVPFTTFPGFEIGPSFSPDGNQIVFAWFGYEKEFQFDLYIKQVGQERVVQVTHHPAIFLVGSWSPDGRSIAFMRQAEPEASGIYVISSLGGPERKVADITSYGSWEPIALSWSPDSKWVAFPKMGSPESHAAATPEGFRIHLVNVDTTEERAIPAPSRDCLNMWQPAFSPDGKYLASVCVITDGVAKIFLQTREGNQPREVVDTRYSQSFSGIAWSADSHSLLYTSDQHLWRVPFAGGKPEKLLFAQDVESLSVARTGGRLAYAQVRHPSSVWQLELAGEELAQGPATRLISSSRGDSDGQPSPDGKYIAFQSRRSGSPEIWMCDRDASNPVQLTFFGGPQIGSPSWSPDSRRIVFDLRASGNAELYVVNAAGGPPKQLPTGTPNASSPAWARDGRAIYFSTEPPDAIWKVPVDGGAAVRLTAAGAPRSTPREAPDGTRVFFDRGSGDHGQMWSSSTDGSGERPVAGMPTDVGWVPSANGAYFIQGPPRHYFLNHFDFATQRIRKVADLPGVFALWGTHLSPDGHTFLFSGIEHSEGDIMLVDGFR